MKLTSKEIKDICFAEGAEVAGISPVERFVNERPGHGPADRLAVCRSVIVVGSPFPRNLLWMDQTEYTRTRREMSSRVRDVARRVEEHLLEAGYKAKVVSVFNAKQDEADFIDHMSMKRAAEYAGLGRVIRNHLLTSPVYGNHLWFAAILTDGEFAPDSLVEEKLCGGCDLCVMACPAGALNDPEEFNQKACDQVRLKIVDGQTEVNCYECRRACPMRFGKPVTAEPAGAQPV